MTWSRCTASGSCVTGNQLVSSACALLLQLQEREPKSLEEVVLEEGKKHECGGWPLRAAK
jgi:hypothetical protein